MVPVPALYGEIMTEQQRANRNLNPHKPAVVAMWRWGGDYVAQRGGSMDFWDSLPESRRRFCREMVAAIAAAPDEAPVDNREISS
jgi:hypothetical protein